MNDGLHTRAHANGLKRKLAHRMGQVEALAEQMRSLLADHSVSFDAELDAMRARLADLEAVIDRRTRPSKR